MAIVGKLSPSISYFAKRKILGVSTQSGNNSDGELDDSTPPAIDEVLNYLGASYEGDSLNKFERVEERGTSEDTIGLQEGYVGVFVRLLGLDNPEVEREEAVRALWRHSAGGKYYIDQIMEFPGCLNLIVSLLRSHRTAAAEAAAGVLRNISSIETYRSAVTEAGALEEILGLLTRRDIPEVREHATCVLWNLSVEEGPRAKLVNPEILQVLSSMLGSEKDGEREAAAGVLANLTQSSCYSDELVKVGIIPKLAKILLDDGHGTKVSRQEAKNALIRLGQERHIEHLIIEEGLVFVPVIGASAYRSFKPLLQEAPTLPESVDVLQTAPKVPSTFGAGNLLLGLNWESRGNDIDDASRLIIEGRVRQQFLARVGVIGKKSSKTEESGDEQVTLMSWWDGITRLVLILGLDNLNVAKQAVQALGSIAINEDNRQAIQKSGAIPHLVRLLGCGDEDIALAVTSTLNKLAISRQVRRSINSHNAQLALVAILNSVETSDDVREEMVCALSRLSKAEEEMEAVIQDGTISGLIDIVSSERASIEEKEEAEEILEEVASLKSEPRDGIVTGGGLPHLLKIMERASVPYAEQAACLLDELATNSSNANAILAAGVESSLSKSLKLLFDEVTVVTSDEIVLDREDGYRFVAALSRLVQTIARSAKFENPSELAKILRNILQDESAPLNIKDWVSASLIKLEQVCKGFGEDNPVEAFVDFEVHVRDTIPWLVRELGPDFSPIVRERAVTHLRLLLCQGSNAYATAVASAGAVDKLADLLKSGSDIARAASVSVLYTLSMNEENHPAMLAAGLAPCLVELVRRKVPEWRLAFYLLRALPK
ncbi:hypothetical protein AXG93_4794s1240 [Marchantia polymorpha subsp. ruderalis]|nr:hypothetical protein AXG93_4794s1240 [Marchantia polymorpha subsp. ruderalis]